MRIISLAICLAFGSIAALGQSTEYSTNIVAYCVISIPPGYSLLANPLSTGATNGANEIMPILDGEVILTWDGFSFQEVQYDSSAGGWVESDDITPARPPSLPPGKGFFFFNPNATATNFTFIGQVVPGPSDTNCLLLAPGYSLIGSVLPATVARITDQPIALPTLDGVMILKWDGAGYLGVMFDSAAGGWVLLDDKTPAEAPPYTICDAFFLFNPNASQTCWRQSLP